MKNYIMLDGNKVEISAETAENFRKQFGEKTYSIGDRLQYNGSKYILAYTGHTGSEPTVGLVSLDSGSTWNSRTTVDCTDKITSDEFTTLTAGRHYTRYWNAQKQEKC